MVDTWKEHEDETVGRWQTKLSSILPVLRGHRAVWHRTSLKDLDAILKHGAIEPNDGRFPFSYPQSEKCYARRIGAVSLFDFDSQSLREIILQAHHWAAFLRDKGDLTAWTKIGRERLVGINLMLPGQIRHEDMRVERGGGRPPYIPPYIPRVEAWYKGAIPVNAIQEILLVKDAEGYPFERIGGNDRDALTLYASLRSIRELASTRRS